ncbi:unnamed protein product, partial [Prorocentrum cordatum]
AMQWQAPPNRPLWLVLWSQLGELVQEQLSQSVRERELAAARNWTASAAPPPPPSPPPSPAAPAAAWAAGAPLWAAAECPALEPAAEECPAAAPEPPAGWASGPLLWWAGQVFGGAAWRLWQDGSGIEDDEVWWVLSPDGDVWKERLDGEIPLTGPSGARPMPNVGYPLLGARRLYKFRERPNLEQIMALSRGCRDVETARGQKMEEWPKYVIGDDGHRTELSAVLRAPRGDLAQLVDASPTADTIWVLMEPGGGRAIGEEVHMTPADVMTGSDGLKFMGSEVSRVRRVAVGSAPALASEQIARLRRAIGALEPLVDRSMKKGVKDQLGRNTSENGGEVGSGEERKATSSVDDVRTLSVDFDGRSE